ncbi:hypothetical protein V3C99_014289 [Haemonchus contortus]
MTSCHCAVIIYPLLLIMVASSSTIVNQKLHKSIVKEFHDIDTDKDELVTLQEVLEHWKEHVRKMTKVQMDILKEGYKCADLNHDGRINATEFEIEVRRVLADIHFPKVHNHTAGIFRTTDFNVSNLYKIK